MAKSISNSVGRFGTNFFNDVLTIQYLLNCVPVSRGGPIHELEIDGFLGPATRDTIFRFQNAHFGSGNGLIEPKGETMGYLSAYDPAPYSPPVPSLFVARKSG